MEEKIREKIITRQKEVERALHFCDRLFKLEDEVDNAELRNFYCGQIKCLREEDQFLESLLPPASKENGS